MNGESKLGNIASAFTLRGMLKTEQYCPALTVSVHTAKYEHCLVTKQGGSFDTKSVAAGWLGVKTDEEAVLQSATLIKQ